jgi:hypothetical protein
MEGKNTPHILNTASNLLGLCFIIITLLKTSSAHQNTFVDELVAIEAFIFCLSCVFFVSFNP